MENLVLLLMLMINRKRKICFAVLRCIKDSMIYSTLVVIVFAHFHSFSLIHLNFARVHISAQYGCKSTAFVKWKQSFIYFAKIKGVYTSIEQMIISFTMTTFLMEHLAFMHGIIYTLYIQIKPSIILNLHRKCECQMLASFV